MSPFTEALNSDPRLAAEVIDLARTAAVLPAQKRARLLRLADELLNEPRETPGTTP